MTPNSLQSKQASTCSASDAGNTAFLASKPSASLQRAVTDHGLCMRRALLSPCVGQVGSAAGCHRVSMNLLKTNAVPAAGEHPPANHLQVPHTPLDCFQHRRVGNPARVLRKGFLTGPLHFFTVDKDWGALALERISEHPPPRPLLTATMSAPPRDRNYGLTSQRTSPHCVHSNRKALRRYQDSGSSGRKCHDRLALSGWSQGSVAGACWVCACSNLLILVVPFHFLGQPGIAGSTKRQLGCDRLQVHLLAGFFTQVYFDSTNVTNGQSRLQGTARVPSTPSTERMAWVGFISQLLHLPVSP